MNCIIIDDEPLAREAMEMLVEENKELCLLSMFNNAVSAARFMEEHSVDFRPFMVVLVLAWISMVLIFLSSSLISWVVNCGIILIKT